MRDKGCGILFLGPSRITDSYLDKSMGRIYCGGKGWWGGDELAMTAGGGTSTHLNRPPLIRSNTIPSKSQKLWD